MMMMMRADMSGARSKRCMPATAAFAGLSTVQLALSKLRCLLLREFESWEVLTAVVIPCGPRRLLLGCNKYNIYTYTNNND